MKLPLSFVLFFLSIIILCPAQPKSGIFKMGLISYSYADSSASQDRSVIYVLNELKNSSEHDLYFTPDESMRISKVQDAVKKEIYDNKNKIIYTLMEKGKLKWYTIDSFPDVVFSPSDTSAEYQAMLKSIEVSSLLEDQKTIFGFKCEKFTVHSLENDNQKVIFYRTNKISMPEIMDPISHFIPGTSLETTFFYLPGIVPTIGAISFTAKKFRKKHFGINLKKYRKVTATELELELWNLN